MPELPHHGFDELAPPRLTLILSLIIGSFCFSTSSGQTPAELPDSGSDSAVIDDSIERFFESEVRPLLSKACLDCHGPRKSESGLRLDSSSGLRKGGDSGSVIDEAAPEHSLLLQAVSHENEIRMPPDERLKDPEIAVLRKWVQLGAPWPAGEPTTAAMSGLRAGAITDHERQHWAYQPIRKSPVPQVDSTPQIGASDEMGDWAITDIDHFILAELTARGLRPAADADRPTWLRRLAFDLTGLPPTLEDTEEFVSDASPNAYNRVIDRLLASPEYGRRWGKHWLDLVRYADTAGDGADYPAPEAYRYRNYVIDAFNQDMPFHQFVSEQIAGDILAHRDAATSPHSPQRFAEQVTATGYIAITKRFGYNINNEFQHLDIADTLDNLGQAFLGLSIGCARCHDHKYDAITAEDYYALYGIFSSTQYSFPGGEEHKRPHNLVALVPPAEVAAIDERIAQEIRQIDGQIGKIESRRQSILDRATRGVSRDPGWELQTQGKPGGSPWFTAGPNTILADAQSPFSHVEPAGSQGIRIAHGKPTDGIRQEFTEVTLAQAPAFYFNLDFRNVEAVEGDGSYRFYLGNGAIRSLGFEFSVNSKQFSARDGDQFRIIRDLQPGRWYNLQIQIDLAKKTYSGRIGTPGDVVRFENLSAAPTWDGVLNTFVSDGFGQVQAPSPTRDVDNVVGDTVALQPLPELPSQGGHLTETDVLSGRVKDELADLANQAERLAKSREEIGARWRYPTAYGVSEGSPADARIQRRGEPDRLGDSVPRRFLDVLGGDRLPTEAGGSGRAELAQWLTRPSNPLTARVLVNRVWHHLFGQGLVATPNDFGVRGTPPSQPELLDFLAAEFMADGWSIKRLQRRILSSRVYRLSSLPCPEHVAADPENRLLGRHRRRPLDAESIRDAMLAVSGQLNHATGGPHPFPDVKSWGFSIHYPFHAIYDSDHRSVFLMIPRARRQPFLALFDAADPNISTPTRQPTITPTQGLYLMNAPFVHAQATALENRLAEITKGTDSTESSTPAMNIRQAYRVALGRWPSDEEIVETQAFLDESIRWLSSAGDPNPTRSANRALCRVLLTSNHFLYID